jgi:hypothetical protein
VLGLKENPKNVKINGKIHEHKYDANTERLFVNKINFDLVEANYTIFWE